LKGALHITDKLPECCIKELYDKGRRKNEVVLYIKANKDNTPARTTVSQVYNISDYAGNIYMHDKIMQVR
jgi:hypothetical protein